MPSTKYKHYKREVQSFLSGLSSEEKERVLSVLQSGDYEPQFKGLFLGAKWNLSRNHNFTKKFNGVLEESGLKTFESFNFYYNELKKDMEKLHLREWKQLVNDVNMDFKAFIDLCIVEDWCIKHQKTKEWYQIPFVKKEFKASFHVSATMFPGIEFVMKYNPIEWLLNGDYKNYDTVADLLTNFFENSADENAVLFARNWFHIFGFARFLRAQQSLTKNDSLKKLIADMLPQLRESEEEYKKQNPDEYSEHPKKPRKKQGLMPKSASRDYEPLPKYYDTFKLGGTDYTVFELLEDYNSSFESKVKRSLP